MGIGLGGVWIEEGIEPRSSGLLVMGSMCSPLSLSGGVREPGIM